MTIARRDTLRMVLSTFIAAIGVMSFIVLANFVTFLSSVKGNYSVYRVCVLIGVVFMVSYLALCLCVFGFVSKYSSPSSSVWL